jgi:ADP-heptose:LPS heptosyltransferase
MQKKIKKVLIIRFSSIGDIVWTSPVVRCAKKQLPGVELHYCTKIQYKSMVEASPYIDKIYYLEDSLGALIKKLKKEKYDFVIDLHRNIRTFMIKASLGTKSKAYDKLRIKRLLFTNFQINFMPNCHVVDRYFDAAAPLGIKNDGEA